MNGCCWEIRQLPHSVCLNRTQSPSSWVERSYDSTEIIKVCLNVQASLYITPKIYEKPKGNYEIDAQLLNIITRVDRQGPWLWGCCVSLGMRHQETEAWQSVCEWYTCSMCSVLYVHKWVHECTNVYMSVGVPAVCAFAVPLRMHMHVQHVSGFVCPLVSLQYLCVTLLPCGSICVWVVTDFVSHGWPALLECLTEDVVYLMVKAQFARSRITLIFMFVALKGPYFGKCDQG